MLELYDFQQAALDDTRRYNRVAYYYDMGLGKTFIGSEKVKELGNKCNLIVIQKSKMLDWIEHYETYYPEFENYNLRNKNQLEKFVESKDELRVGFINYELTFRRPILSELKDFTMLLDESSYIKNNTAKRTRFIMKLKAENVILLSGTPVAGKYEELWTQSKLLGWDITKKQFYKDFIRTHRIDVGGFPIEIVTGYRNVDRLKRKLAEHGARFKKTDEVMTLPDTVDTTISVAATPAYRRFKKELYVEVEDGVELIGNTTLEKMLYERQLCGQYNRNKITAFKEHLEGTSNRVIVFYNFTEEYKRLKDVVDKLDRPISVVNGSSRDLDAFETESDSVTFIQYQAGSMGLNLQKANQIVYFTPPLSAEHYIQSKKRIHRIGQEETCFYYYLKVKGSIENKIYNSLEKGVDFTNKLFEK